jgi:hypothetical protein
METTTTPTLEKSLAKFASRVAEGKATSEELAFMKELVARRPIATSIDGRDLSREVSSLS